MGRDDKLRFNLEHAPKTWKKDLEKDYNGWPAPEQWFYIHPTSMEMYVQKDFELFGHYSIAGIQEEFKEYEGRRREEDKEKIEKSIPPGWKPFWEDMKKAATLKRKRKADPAK